LPEKGANSRERLFTNVAVNNGNVIGIAGRLSTSILARVIIATRELSHLIQGVFIPEKPVTKVLDSRAELKGVGCEVIENRIILSGNVIGHRTLVDTANLVFYQQTDDYFSLLCTIPGVRPGMKAQWDFDCTEGVRLRSSSLIAYWNMLIFRIMVTDEQPLTL